MNRKYQVIEGNKVHRFFTLQGAMSYFQYLKEKGVRVTIVIPKDMEYDRRGFRSKIDRAKAWKSGP